MLLHWTPEGRLPQMRGLKALCFHECVSICFDECRSFVCFYRLNCIGSNGASRNPIADVVEKDPGIGQWLLDMGTFHLVNGGQGKTERTAAPAADDLPPPDFAA